MFLHHHMRIGAAHAECADSPDAKLPRFLDPGLRPLVDVERALPPLDVIVLLLAMQTGRYGFVPDRLNEADQADEPGRREGMAEIALGRRQGRSEEHTSELQSLMRISYAVFCLKKKKNKDRTKKILT